ncbi:hypothetical protein Mapa_011713 [Marchantia paleacea]|nr:hypothetical protein Mapa_011713 [Marchantia paleacea]
MRVQEVDGGSVRHAFVHLKVHQTSGNDERLSSLHHSCEQLVGSADVVTVGHESDVQFSRCHKHNLSGQVVRVRCDDATWDQIQTNQ